MRIADGHRIRSDGQGRSMLIGANPAQEGDGGAPRQADLAAWPSAAGPRAQTRGAWGPHAGFP